MRQIKDAVISAAHAMKKKNSSTSGISVISKVSGISQISKISKISQISKMSGIFIISAFCILMAAGCGNSVAETEEEQTAAEAETEEEASVEEEESGADGDAGSIFSRKDDTGRSDGEKEENDDNDGITDPADGWGKAYHDYLNENPAEDGGYCYALIYVDDDDIPELVISTEFEAGGCQILTWHDGMTDVFQTSRLYFTYIEKGNKLDNEEGHMGYYYDIVCTIEDGKWKEIWSGEYSGFDNEADADYDEATGRYICTDYMINGKETDRETYNKELEKVYDHSKASEVTSYISYDDLLSYLDTGKLLCDNRRYELCVKDCTWDQARAECEKKGGFLACMTSDEEFDKVENLIRQEDKTNICFYVGAVRDQYRWEWIEPGLTHNSCVNSEYYKHWLDGGPSYTDVLPDGTEIDEDRCELLYKKGEDRFYLNDITNDVPGVYPSFRGRIGYIVEYIVNE